MMTDLQKRAQDYLTRLKALQLRGNTPPGELGIREEIADFIGELVAEVERLQEEVKQSAEDWLIGDALSQALNEGDGTYRP